MKIKYHYLGIVLVWLILSLAAGMRWLGEDRDYISYIYFYELLSSNLLFAFEQFRFEPGFVFLAWVSINLIGLKFESFLVLVAAIALGIKFFLFFRRPYPWLLVIAYVPSLYLLHEMTQIRVALASAFFYLALENYFNNKNWLTSVLFFLAILFHSSFLVFLPFFFIPKLWIARNKFISLNITSLIFIILIIIFIFILSQLHLEEALPFLTTLNPQSTWMIDKASLFEEVNYFSTRSIVLFFLTCIGILVYAEFDINEKYQITIGIYGFIFFVLLGSSPVFAQRLFELCMLSYFLWVTSAPRYFLLPATSALLSLITYLGYKGLFIDPLFH